jgi:hypothetical protein
LEATILDPDGDLADRHIEHERNGLAGHVFNLCEVAALREHAGHRRNLDGEPIPVARTNDRGVNLHSKHPSPFE